MAIKAKVPQSAIPKAIPTKTTNQKTLMESRTPTAGEPKAQRYRKTGYLGKHAAPQAIKKGFITRRQGRITGVPNSVKTR